MIGSDNMFDNTFQDWLSIFYNIGRSVVNDLTSTRHGRQSEVASNMFRHVERVILLAKRTRELRGTGAGPNTSMRHAPSF